MTEFMKIEPKDGFEIPQNEGWIAFDGGGDVETYPLLGIDKKGGHISPNVDLLLTDGSVHVGFFGTLYPVLCTTQEDIDAARKDNNYVADNGAVVGWGDILAWRYITPWPEDVETLTIPFAPPTDPRCTAMRKLLLLRHLLSTLNDTLSPRLG